MNPQNQPQNPFLGFFQNAGNVLSNAGNAVVNAIQSNPTIKNAEDYVTKTFPTSPIGEAAMGHPENVPASAAKLLSDTLTGKYRPQVQFGGEMGEVPGMGLAQDAATSDAQAAASGGTSFKSGQNLFKNAAMKVNQVNKLQLPGSVNGAGKEEFARNVLNNDVPGANLSQKYKNLGTTMDHMGNQIQERLTSNPKLVPIADLKNNFMNNLESTLRTGDLNQKSAQGAVDGYIADLKKSVQPTTPWKPDPLLSEQQNTINQINHANNNPDAISTPDLFKMKQLVNKDYNSVAKKIDNGTTLNPKEKVIAAARKTLDDTITQYHPDVKDLTMKQSALYDMAEPLAKGRNLDQNVGLNLPFGLGGKPFSVDLPASGLVRQGAASMLNFAGDHPAAASAALGVGGVAAGIGGNQMYNNLQQTDNPLQGNTQQAQPDSQNIQPYDQQDNSTNHASSIAKNNVGLNGRYGLPQGYSMYKDATSQYTNAQAQLNQKIAADQAMIASGNTVGGNTQLAQDQADLKTLSNQWENSQPQRTAGSNLEAVTRLSNLAIPLINKADLSVLNSLNGSYDALLSSQDKNNVALGKSLSMIQQLTGVDLSHVKSKDGLIAGLDQAYSMMRTKYDQVGTGSDGSSASLPLPVSAPSTASSPSNLGQAVDYHSSINGGSPQFSNGSPAMGGH